MTHPNIQNSKYNFILHNYIDLVCVNILTPPPPPFKNKKTRNNECKRRFKM